MPIHSLTEFGNTSAGVILPKGDLRMSGCIDEDGELVDGQMVEVRSLGDGEWEVSLIDPDDYPL